VWKRRLLEQAVVNREQPESAYHILIKLQEYLARLFRLRLITTALLESFNSKTRHDRFSLLQDIRLLPGEPKPEVLMLNIMMDNISSIELALQARETVS